MTVELSVDFAGVRFANPFLLASGPLTMSTEHIRKAAKAGWGGAILKTVGLGDWDGVGGYRDHRPCYWVYSDCGYVDKPPSVFSFSNLTGRGMLGDAKWFGQMVKETKIAGMPAIASITRARTLDEWTKLATAVEAAGVDMIEVNISCPVPLKGHIMGIGPRYMIGQDPPKTKEVVKAVMAGCSVPVMVKLNAGVAPQTVLDVAKAVEEADANAISATNTFLGIPGIDVESGLPISLMENQEGKVQSGASAISGPIIKPVALRCVAEIKQTVSLPISGIGGITDWRSAVEFFMVGATTVQLATAPLVYGFRMIRGMVRELTKFMAKKGYTSIHDFCGLSLKYFGPHIALKYEQQVEATVNSDRCDGCGRCLVVSDTGGCGAITVENQKAIIDHNRCYGCNLCTIVCPRNAIFLSGLPST